MEIDSASARPDRARGADRSGRQDLEPVIVEQMRHRPEDIDFSSECGLEALAKLPGMERKPWQELWDDVSKTLARAQANTAPKKSPPRSSSSPPIDGLDADILKILAAFSAPRRTVSCQAGC
jgi:hypothetical protein